MLRAWPLLFFIVPLIEIYFLVQVGEEIGAGMTVLVVIITAVIGVALLRQQGLRTLMRANQAMQAGQMPAQELFDGFILAAVGILLVTPGFFTDAIGFLLLIPSIRKALMRTLLKNMTVQTYSAYQHDQREPPRRSPFHSSVEQDDKGHHTIDGEYKRED